MGQKLAKFADADNTCPLTTAIMSRIVIEVSIVVRLFFRKSFLDGDFIINH